MHVICLKILYDRGITAFLTAGASLLVLNISLSREGQTFISVF